MKSLVVALVGISLFVEGRFFMNEPSIHPQRKDVRRK